MDPLEVTTTWARMLSVTAGACAAAGAPGPGTRIRGKPALDFGSGPWLGLIDFEGLRRPERETLLPWLRERIEPLLLVRHLLLAKPLGEEVFIELGPRALEAMPEGFRDAPRPILILAPAGRGIGDRPRRRKRFRVEPRRPSARGLCRRRTDSQPPQGSEGAHAVLRPDHRSTSLGARLPRRRTVLHRTVCGPRGRHQIGRASCRERV